LLVVGCIGTSDLDHAAADALGVKAGAPIVRTQLDAEILVDATTTPGRSSRLGSREEVNRPRPSYASIVTDAVGRDVARRPSSWGLALPIEGGGFSEI
jgi:hypothetical protein